MVVSHDSAKWSQPLHHLYFTESSCFSTCTMSSCDIDETSIAGAESSYLKKCKREAVSVISQPWTAKILSCDLLFRCIM